MRSLRSRLIVGIALVAIAPLALAIVLLSSRIGTMVRVESAARLQAGIADLKSELETQHRRTETKLQILSRDPGLKRLYLVGGVGSRELNDYLTERRFLIDLDFLEIADASGTVVPFRAAADTAGGPVQSSESPILYDGKVVGRLRGGRYLNRPFLEDVKRRRGLDLVLHNADGRAFAATLPSAATPRNTTRIERVTIDGRIYWSQAVPLEVRGSAPLTLTALTPTDAADRAIADLRWTAALLALGGLGLAILLGSLWSSQVSRPVERLAEYSRRLARGEWDEPVALRSVRELETLGKALDRMRADLVTYREKLVTSERHAAWGLMARKVAHEVKNPLTPIAISIADLKRSHDQGRPEFPAILDQAVRTISAEVDSLKRLLQEFSDFGRLPPPKLEPIRADDLLADVRTLHGREVEAGRLRVDPPDVDVTLRADPDQIRQVLVNLVKNGIEAVNGNGQVSVSARTTRLDLVLQVSDTGPGLTEEQRAALFTPGFTTKAHGSGLGLTIVERIVSDHGGTISVESTAGRGTIFTIRLPLEGT